jgi:ribosome-binding factor A
MAKEFSRTQRLGDQIQKDVAQLIQFNIKDPRLGLVTITAVKVSRDLTHASVYFTVLSFDEDAQAKIIKETEGVLNDAAGFLRSELSQGLKTRITPKLRFHYDVSVARGSRLTSLIQQVRSEDKERVSNRGDQDVSNTDVNEDS